MNEYSHILKLLEDYIQLMKSEEFSIGIRQNTHYTQEDIEIMISTAHVIYNLINGEVIKELAIMGAEMEKQCQPKA
jgi:hypothetical protein